MTLRPDNKASAGIVLRLAVDQEIQERTFRSPVVTIGRQAGNDWIVVHRSISRRHAQIERRPEGYVLRDLGSSNGIKVNGARVSGVRLFPGTVVQVGTCDLTVVSVEGVGIRSAPLPPPPSPAPSMAVPTRNLKPPEASPHARRPRTAPRRRRVPKRKSPVPLIAVVGSILVVALVAVVVSTRNGEGVIPPEGGIDRVDIVEDREESDKNSVASAFDALVKEEETESDPEPDPAPAPIEEGTKIDPEPVPVLPDPEPDPESSRPAPGAYDERVDVPEGMVARGHEMRIDIRWECSKEGRVSGYNIYRASSPSGPWSKLNARPHPVNVYSDFIGRNDARYYYRVSKVVRKRKKETYEEYLGKGYVASRSRRMSDEELLTSLQEAVFSYFWEYGHKESGLAMTRYYIPGHLCTAGGTGFGLIALIVGVERGFVTREACARRVLKMVTFLQDKAERFHGVWSHWINGSTGKVIRFSEFDDGADLVETSFLVQGLLTVARYFDGTDSVEREIRRRVDRLWREVEWDWFLRKEKGKKLTWHWSPNHGWKKNLGIGGRYNECMITYLLAIASPTHPIPPDCYYGGWANPRGYVNGKSYYGHTIAAGRPFGGPLFFTHYSFIGFDPRGKRDRYCNYFENNRAISLSHRAYAIANPEKHKGYGENAWGLTACYTPDGYSACAPGPKTDNGTIAPTASLSAMPYVPEESMAALKHLYSRYGKRLWGPFGFYDSFNPGRDWYSNGYIAIDQGPIICMIENYRTGLCWRMFMSNPEIVPTLRKIGWTFDAEIRK